MILGDSRNVDPQTLEAFRRSGAAHLLAASGMHVGLVSGLCAAGVRMMGGSRRFAEVAAIVVGGMYAVTAGLRASVVRAWLMLFVAVAARARRRKADPPACAHHVCSAPASDQPIASLECGVPDVLSRSRGPYSCCPQNKSGHESKAIWSLCKIGPATRRLRGGSDGNLACGCKHDGPGSA